jgi:Right handed beta helix region
VAGWPGFCGNCSGMARLLVIVVLLFLLGWVASARAETFVVSARAPEGGSGSMTSPFQSISDAVEAAGPGDTIVVHGGTYTLGSTLWLSKAGLHLTGVSGERALIVGDEKVNALITIVADGVTLQELTLQGGFYGIKVDVDTAKSTRNVSIRNCEIGSTAADCLKLFNADNLLIESCHIGPSGWQQKENAEGIDAVGSLKITIRGCLIEDIATNGVYLKGGTRDGVVERCLVRRCGNGGILLGQDTDPEFMRNGVRNEAIHCVARNNIVVDTRTAGLGAYSAKDVAFENNTLIDVAKEGQAALWVVTNGREVPSENVRFINNIVVVGGDRPALFAKDAAGFPISDHNLFEAKKGRVRFVREVSSDDSLTRQWTFAEWKQVTGQDAHSQEAAPRLDLRMYRPDAGSPASSGGAKVDGFAEDYFGRRRSETGWGIGAVMAGPGAVTGPTTRP